VLHLIHLVPSLENLAKMVVTSAIHSLIPSNIDSTNMDPSIPRLPLQLARDGMDSPELFTTTAQLICYLILDCSGCGDAFRAAVVESFFASPQLLSRLTELGEEH
jgi:hypothetical protein